MVDQWALQQVAKEAFQQYVELWELKMSATHAPQRERTTMATPGPSSPNGDNDMTLDLEGMLLESIEQDDHADMPIGLHAITIRALACTSIHGLAVPKSGAGCCDLIKIYCYEIAEKFDRAEELYQLLEDQARYISFFISVQEERIHGQDGKAKEDIFLTADSLQRALEMRSLECLPETVRKWAQRGHIAISRTTSGGRTYSLKDVVSRLNV